MTVKFYFNLSPNPWKVALFLEEAGLHYEGVPVDTCRGEQFHDDYLAINPNGKVPTIQDGDVVVFDSTAILMYLAEKTGRFLSANDPKARGELLSWMMFVASGIGPYAGQAVHFRHFAPKGSEYAMERYQFEARRHFGILDARLASRTYLLGDTYTIVDMAAWGWSRAIPFMMGDTAWGSFPHLKRWFDAISARPAALAVDALQDKYAFKAEMDEEARRVLFKHTAAAPH